MPANRFNAFTDYGVGIGLRVPHYDHILCERPAVDWFEIISENYIVDGGRPLKMLDQILERLVEREEPIADIVAAGFDRDTVVKIERMLNLAEYKRRQAAPGVKVTLRNFGRDRRYPIVNRFRDPGAAVPATAIAAPRGIAASSEAADF